MTEEEKKLNKKIDDLQQKLDSFLDVYYRINLIDKQVYKYPSFFQKVAFFGSKTLAEKQPAISSPAGGGTAGVDTPARTAIDSIILALKNLGLTL